MAAGRLAAGAAVGAVESGHAAGSSVNAFGDVWPLVLGPVLDGTIEGLVTIPDTDNGRFDLDLDWDRAVGPMQLLPATVVHRGVDGNGDGIIDPHNIWDATASASAYLCVAQTGTTVSQAVFAYNHSEVYVDSVLEGYVEIVQSVEESMLGCCRPARRWATPPRLSRTRCWARWWSAGAAMSLTFPVRTRGPVLGSRTAVATPLRAGSRCANSVTGPRCRYQGGSSPRVTAGCGGLLPSMGIVSWPVPVSSPPQPPASRTPLWWAHAVPADSSEWTAAGAMTVTLPATAGAAVYAPEAGEAGGAGDCGTVIGAAGVDVAPLRVAPSTRRRASAVAGARIGTATGDSLQVELTGPTAGPHAPSGGLGRGRPETRQRPQA